MHARGWMILQEALDSSILKASEINRVSNFKMQGNNSLTSKGLVFLG